MSLGLNELMPFQGLKRSDQQQMLDLYRARNPHQATPGHHDNQPTASQHYHQPVPTPEQESSRIRKLEKLIKRL